MIDESSLAHTNGCTYYLEVTMRHTILFCLMLVLALPLLAQVNIAYVNVDTLLQKCEACKAAESQYQAAMEAWDAELQSMADELDGIQAQLDMPLSDTRKAEVQADFDEKKAKFEARQVEIYGQQGSAMQLNYDLMMPLLDHIQKAMESYAKENNIQIIFDGDTGEILYMTEGVEPMDATGNILDYVNARKIGE